MLEFCALELQECSAARRGVLEKEVAALAMRWGDGARKFKFGDLEAAHTELRNFLVSIARRGMYSTSVPEAEWTFVRVEDDKRLPKSGAQPRPGARSPGRISRSYRVPIPIALVLHAADMLDVVGAERLLACPFADQNGPCAQVFLAKRRQRYCSLEHSKKAAWLAWLQRQGGTRAKA